MNRLSAVVDALSDGIKIPGKYSFYWGPLVVYPEAKASALVVDQSANMTEDLGGFTCSPKRY